MVAGAAEDRDRPTFPPRGCRGRWCRSPARCRGASARRCPAGRGRRPGRRTPLRASRACPVHRDPGRAVLPAHHRLAERPGAVRERDLEWRLTRPRVAAEREVERIHQERASADGPEFAAALERQRPPPLAALASSAANRRIPLAENATSCRSKVRRVSESAVASNSTAVGSRPPGELRAARRECDSRSSCTWLAPAPRRSHPWSRASP